MSRDYHLRELAIALNESDPHRALPTIAPHYRRILDVGCGAGQTLIAAHLDPEVEALGLEVDAEAVALGVRLCPTNVHLVRGSGEGLPFRDSHFDFVYSRLALPYMHIDRSVKEMFRVLRPGGDLWLSLHQITLTLRQLRAAIVQRKLKSVLYRSYVLLNGGLFNLFGLEFSCPILNNIESYQSPAGINRSLRHAGFEEIRLSMERHFIAVARKPLANV